MSLHTSVKPAGVSLYNTLSRQVEPLVPRDPQRLTMYVCGPTVYGRAHLGNARPAVVFDVLARVLRHCHPSVVYARNITDIDDKINAAAQAEGVPIGVITERSILAWHADMAALGNLPPDAEPRATEHVPQIIDTITALIQRGHAYEAQGHVLFHVPSFAEYGQLSRRTRADQIAGARVEVAPYKRDAADFVLWKPSNPEQPGWVSPWGRGRPGWHIECTAMIEQHLGLPIDLHGGGQDLIFPHHENEIAQGRCAHDGAPYCGMWVHNSFVTVEGRKMAKSIGNVLLVEDLLRQAEGRAVRLALLQTHYRHPLDWTSERLSSACRTLNRLRLPLQGLSTSGTLSYEAEPDAQVLHALCKDLNTPMALARLHAMADAVKRADGEQRQQLADVYLASLHLLGLA